MDEETKTRIRECLEADHNISMCKEGWENVYEVIEKKNLLYEVLPPEVLEEFVEYDLYARDVYDQKPIKQLSRVPQFYTYQANLWYTMNSNATSIQWTTDGDNTITNINYH